MNSPELDAFDRLEDAAQRRLGDGAAIEAALRGRIGVQGKLVRRPDRPRVELGSRLEDRDAPALLSIGDGPVERGRAAIANDAGVHDQAEIARRDLLGNRDLQHRRDDHVRRVARNRVHHRLARGYDADADFMAAFGQFDKEPLAEAVMRGGQKKNFHGNELPFVRKSLAKLLMRHLCDSMVRQNVAVKGVPGASVAGDLS